MAICKCYDIDERRCNGTRERDHCLCEGNRDCCDFYEEVRNEKQSGFLCPEQEKAPNKLKQVEESKPDIVENLKAKIQRLEDENKNLLLDKAFSEGFRDAVYLLLRGKRC